MNKQDYSFKKWIDKAVIIFAIGYGLHYFAYFLRARYYTMISNPDIDEGISHILLYLGHLYFLVTMFLYATVVKSDRKYIFSFSKGKISNNLKNFLLGSLIGFVMVIVCVACAVISGNLTIERYSGLNPLLFVFAIFAVLVQASTEEIESRSFIYGKTADEGVPVKYAMIISSFFFSYLHAAKPGFSYLTLVTLFFFGLLCALSIHYFKNIWFPCGIHMMWNFTQDFILGLPNSGTPSSVSVFSSSVNGSGFFYNDVFGIEGCFMCLLVMIIACVVVFVIGNAQRKN